ncbi:uroporphyrinogen-III synthase [Aliamphritea ceti]|uniref:uroporphyrinogen-III synthase n=1 Tax=Aliamphritea ceti TaxID=1524258 RepID=UPI0021C3DFAA|nr:uroporphyrinogen-III synthase [Aliamphritea ceti]
MANSVLQGLRVLVTRPEHQTHSICSTLETQGAIPVRLPLLQITPVSEAGAGFALLKQKVLDLDLYQQIIVVSPNAARLAGELIDTYWPQLPVGIIWHAIGQKTAETLAEYGITASISLKGTDSEALLSHPSLQNITEQRILIMRGEGGRTLLAETLQSRGARTEYAELYRRSRPDYTSHQINSTIYSSLDAILITSGEALENLFSLLGSHQEHNSQQRGQILSTCLLVPSARVAKLATAHGCRKVYIAQGADSQAMVQALIATIDVEE